MATGSIGALTGYKQGRVGECKLPDGTMIQWGIKSISRNAGQNLATDTFYTPFVNTPVCFCNFATGHPELWFFDVYNADLTTITLCLYNTGTSQSSGTTLEWVAIGRWK